MAVKKSKLFLGAILLLTLGSTFVLMGCAATNLSGTLYFSIDQIPVEGAQITIGDVSATSNAEGNFTLPDMPLNLLEGTITLDDFPEQSFTVDLSDAEEEHHFTLEVPAAQVAFSVIENTQAGDMPSAENIQVLLNLEELRFDLDNEAFETGIMAPGSYTLAINSESHEAYTADFELQAGQNDFEVALDVTLEETYRRFNLANALHRYSESYGYLHPDVQTRVTGQEWSNSFNHNAEVINAAPEGPEVLDEWTSELTGQTYQNVHTFLRPFITELAGSRRASSETQHWVLQEGRWLIVTR